MDIRFSSSKKRHSDIKTYTTGGKQAFCKVKVGGGVLLSPCIYLPHTLGFMRSFFWLGSFAYFGVWKRHCIAREPRIGGALTLTVFPCRQGLSAPNLGCKQTVLRHIVTAVCHTQASKENNLSRN